MDKKGSFTALNCEIAVFPVGLKPAAVSARIHAAVRISGIELL
jgi:hypothetical protein